MLALADVQGNYNMSSQISFHSIKKPSDFTFCDIPRRKYHREQDENENPLGFSSPLWSKNPPLNCTDSSSTTETMAKGRKELMELINDLPESCYELSLKDMVAEDPEDLGYAIEDKVDMKPKVKGKVHNKKVAKRGPISRSVSLDTGVFLLKMFVPSSFGSKKQRVSRSTSIDGLNKRDVDVKQWKTRFIQNKSNISRRSYNNDRCCNTATKKRYEEGTLKPGCWFKLTNQKWCIFF